MTAAIAASGSSATSVLLAYAGVGSSGSRCSLTRSAAGTRPIVSSSGASPRNGASTSSANASSPSTAPSMMANRRPRTSAGIESRSGTSTRRNDVVTCSGASAHHATHPGRTWSTAVPSQARNPATTRLDRLEFELERTDDAERRTATAEGPEQVGVTVGSRSYEGAVGKDDLDCGDGVALQTESPGVPSDPATERVADHADVGGGRMQRGQPIPPGRLRHITPQHAGADAGDPVLGVDAQLRHRGGAQQYGIGQPAAQRRGAVAGALRRDRQAGGLGGADDLGDLLGERGVGDGRGIVGDHQVPRCARHVVRRVAGKLHGAAAEPSKARGPETLLHRHWSLPFWSCVMVTCPT